MDDDALALALFDGVPGVRLAGVVDMRTGFYLAVEVGNCDPEEADRLAAATREIFDGELTAGLRRSYAEAPESQTVREVIVMGDKAVFLFARVRQNEESALAVACGQDANLGILLTTTREIARAR